MKQNLNIGTFEQNYIYKFHLEIQTVKHKEAAITI